MRRAAAVMCLLLVAGCGLPLSKGVQVPKQIPAGQQQRGDIQVLPPGPVDGNSPEQVVRGFFGAQSNPDNQHASARAFLTPERAKTWKDAGLVSVFDSALIITPVRDRPDVFVVSGSRVGLIHEDGSYTRADEQVSVRVQTRRNARKQWQLADVPDGLFLSMADRDRSFRWLSVYFLAPSVDSGPASHLVPDPVFVPVTADPAQALVDRLLAGPSQALGDSVQTAVPAGTTLRRPVTTDASGVVTVDLSRQVRAAPESQKEQLSAQLVWTLRGVQSAFSRLRLQSDGQDVRVGGSSGSGSLQERSDWPAYAPDGLDPQAPAYYVSNRRLRTLDGSQIGGPASEDTNAQPVDAAAISARGGTLAVLTREAPLWVLRTGPVTGPLTVRARDRALVTPSWGDGERGLWFVEGDRVMLAPPGRGVPYGVPVDGIGAFGPVRGLRVSRDGARIALITDTAQGRRLVVGRIRVVGGQVRVAALHAIAPEVNDVRDVSWDSATSLVVLGQVGALPTLPVRVAVDGSTLATLIRVGLENSDPLELAGAPGRQLIVEARTGGVRQLFRDTGRSYTRAARGSAPFYPG